MKWILITLLFAAMYFLLAWIFYVLVLAQHQSVPSDTTDYSNIMQRTIDVKQLQPTYNPQGGSDE